MPCYGKLSCSLVLPSEPLITIVLRPRGSGSHIPVNGAKKKNTIIFIEVLCPFALVSGFRLVDSSDSHSEGEVELVFGHSFVLTVQPSAKMGQTASPPLIRHFGKLGLDWDKDTEEKMCMFLSLRYLILSLDPSTRERDRWILWQEVTWQHRNQKQWGGHTLLHWWIRVQSRLEDPLHLGE